MSYSCALHRSFSKFNQSQHLQYTSWTELWKERVDILHVDGILSQYCGFMGVGVMRSTIEPKRAGMGCYAIV